MALQSTSLAPVVGAAVENVQFLPGAQNLPRKIVVIGNYDETTFTGVVEDVPQRALSPESVGATTGFGFMLHRLVQKVFSGSQGVECWIIPQPENGSAVKADGSINMTGAATAAGNIYLYIAGDRIVVPVAKTDTDTAQAAAIVAAVTADKELPVTAAVDGVDDTQANFTAKNGGIWGNDIDISLNLGFEEELPAGTAAVIVDMASGTTVGDIQDALDGMGTGDEANLEHFTEVVHGYGQDTGTLDALSTYNGTGNLFEGLYSKTVSRPFRSLVGDTEDTGTPLTDLIALSDGRKLDRTNGVLGVPGVPSHPTELAALALGIMARINNDRAAESYIGQVLPGVIPPANSQWNADYDNRDLAVKAGVSPTTVEGNVVKLSSVLTFYHPDSVPITSNGYRSQRNISILQNIMWNIRRNFEQEKWQGISIVADVTKVSNSLDRKKTRDISAVIDDLLALTRAFEGKAWIFSADFTIEKIQAGGLVTIRPGGTGFDSVLPILLSGEAGILDTKVEFDTALDIVLST
jgi:phage tail sheath gpL-like